MQVLIIIALVFGIVGSILVSNGMKNKLPGYKRINANKKPNK